jgi:hypothetical protein
MLVDDDRNAVFTLKCYWNPVTFKRKLNSLMMGEDDYNTLLTLNDPRLQVLHLP